MKTKDEIIDGINELFGDTSVTKQETLEMLDDIAGEVEMLMDVLRSDIRRETGED